jgi:hypothetical protein
MTEDNILPIFLEKSTPEDLEKAILAEDKKISDKGIENVADKRNVRYTVTFVTSVEGEEKKYNGIGGSIEEAVKQAGFPYKDSKAVKKTFEAKVVYTLTPEELEQYKTKKKPTAAGPQITGFRTHENAFF